MDRDRALEQVKVATFMGKNAAFLGCLMCNLQFSWSEEIKTAGVSDKVFLWNPTWFDSLSQDERIFVLLHELWHIALLHGLRLGNRDPEKWNIACDLRINANLIREGYVKAKGGLYEPLYEDDDWSEERIYEDLPNGVIQPQSWGSSLQESTSNTNQVCLVQTALSAAQMVGTTPGNVSRVLDAFLKPKLPWRRVLRNFLLDQLDPEWSWNRPNRRYQDLYLPSLLPQEGRLTKVAMFLDTSGSVDADDIQRFTSEVKFVQEELKPIELIVIQFDTKIQKINVYNENHPFKRIKVRGCGGTNYECLRQYILKNKPTLSVIFTDLYARPMKSVGKNKVLWVVKNNLKDAPIGKTIHVDD